MRTSVFKALLVLGFMVTVAVAPTLAEETGNGAGVMQSGPTGQATVTDGSGEQGGSGTPELFDNEELASLEARAEEPGEEVAGGALTNQQLTYIVIALAAAVIVLILV